MLPSSWRRRDDFVPCYDGMLGVLKRGGRSAKRDWTKRRKKKPKRTRVVFWKRVVHVHIHSTGTLFASFAPRLRRKVRHSPKQSECLNAIPARYGLTLRACARSSLRS